MNYSSLMVFSHHRRPQTLKQSVYSPLCLASDLPCLFYFTLIYTLQNNSSHPYNYSHPNLPLLAQTQLVTFHPNVPTTLGTHLHSTNHLQNKEIRVPHCTPKIQFATRTQGKAWAMPGCSTHFFNSQESYLATLCVLLILRKVIQQQFGF